ncbi:MAG: hypothetical protein CMN30_08000 [Sandaracinus sp.]|nr:hypothetical protein [Sandaracinus sp.]
MSHWALVDGRWISADEGERLAVAVDGASAEEHEWVGRGASLAAALARLRSARVPTTAVTRVTRSNQRSLEAIGAQVRGADAWVLVVPRVRGERFDALGPRLTMAAPWILRAVTGWGPRAFVAGMPLCLVGPHTGRVLATDPRAFGAACARCPAREGCAGVGGDYLERFAGDELRPRPPGNPGPAADLFPEVAAELV